MPNLVMLGAVDQEFEATRVQHATDRITLSIDKRQLNRMQYYILETQNNWGET